MIKLSTTVVRSKSQKVRDIEQLKDSFIFKKRFCDLTGGERKYDTFAPFLID